MIPVTKPFCPPLEEYHELLQGIWESDWFTNNGPLVRNLETELKEYLQVNQLLFVGNGTIALQIAIKALKLTKEIITTPFSYVATTSSIVWEGCTPVFVDINKDTLNIDPSKIEAAITSETQAILATHCFGNPCDIDAITEIAEKNNLKVIYDAAHCFGTKYKGKSVFEYGDISTASFHATKLYHTVEGGAVFTNDPDLLKTMAYMRNFGHDGPERFAQVGINGKNSELHAAMGIVNLKFADEILKRRKILCENYNQSLNKLNLKRQHILSESSFNYSYYPIICESEQVALEVKKNLEKQDIFPRRYFYPSLSNLVYTHGSTPIADNTSTRILCLPLYHQLEKEEIYKISKIIVETIS